MQVKFCTIKYKQKIRHPQLVRDYFSNSSEGFCCFLIKFLQKLLHCTAGQDKLGKNKNILKSF